MEPLVQLRVESDQKTMNFGIHSFPARRPALWGSVKGLVLYVVCSYVQLSSDPIMDDCNGPNRQRPTQCVLSAPTAPYLYLFYLVADINGVAAN